MNPPEEGGKGLIEIEVLYKHIKIKVAHYLNTSHDEHIKLVKSFQSLKSVFKYSKGYIEELQLDCQFNDGATLIRQADQVVMVNGKKPKNIKKKPLRKATKQKRRTAVMEQSWVGKYITQHWKDPKIVPASYQIFKEWRNIPNIVRYDRMLRPLYHSILEKYEFSESDKPSLGIVNKLCIVLYWYKQSHPVPCLENDKAKYCGIFHGVWKNPQETVPTNRI